MGIYNTWVQIGITVMLCIIGVQYICVTGGIDAAYLGEQHGVLHMVLARLGRLLYLSSTIT